MANPVPNLVKKPGKGREPEKQPSEREVDEALDETFPASDPPAYGGSTGAGAPDDAKSAKKARP